MHRPNFGAGQHGNNLLGHAPHEDGNAVAAANAHGP